jgi:hypothetical protein
LAFIDAADLRGDLAALAFAAVATMAGGGLRVAAWITVGGPLLPADGPLTTAAKLSSTAAAPSTLLTASGGFTVVIGLDGLQIALAMVIIKVGQCVASARVAVVLND